MDVFIFYLCGLKTKCGCMNCGEGADMKILVLILAAHVTIAEVHAASEHRRVIRTRQNGDGRRENRCAKTWVFCRN